MTHDSRLGQTALQILPPVHRQQLEEVRQRERPDQQAENAELRDTGDGADQGDQRVDLGIAIGHHGPDQIVDVADQERSRYSTSATAAASDRPCTSTIAPGPHIIPLPTTGRIENTP